jgi:type I restriction enzyme S subunit
MNWDLKPYPAYRDSGVPWLGEVPAHWEVLPNRALFEEVKERDHSDEEMLSVTITRGVIRQHALLVDSSKKDSSNLDRSAYKLVCPGDIAYNKMRAWQGAIGASRQRGIVSPAYVVQRPREGTDSRYLHYLLRTPAFAKEAERWSYGITSDMWSLRPEHLKMIYSCRPSLPEQSAIIRFLNHADRRVRRYIRAKQKLIKLLNEQKRTIIQRAVTRGINPNIRLKPSGVEWLGHVPEHWEVLLSQRIFKEEIRPHCGEPETQLSLSQVDGLIATSEMQERSLQTSTYDNWKVTIPGDLVLNRFKAHLGVFFSSTLRGIVSFHYGVFAPRRRLVSKYFELLYHTVAYRTIFAGRSNGMTVGLQNLSNQNFYSARSVVPPVQEQAEIVAFAETATERLNDAIGAAEREMALLLEFRTRLIADVVTGKLDVREVAAILPDESDEPDMLDDADALIEGDGEAVDTELNTASEGVEE